MDIVFLVVACSSVLQLAALLLAIRLIPITKDRKAWLLLSITFGLMFLRRILSLIEIGSPAIHAITKGLPSELVGLAISLLLVASMYQVRAMFLDWQADREARRFSESRLAEIADHSPGMLFEMVLKPDGSFYLTYASQQSRELLNVDPEVLVGPQFDPFSIVTEEDRLRARKAVQESASRLELLSHELRVTRFDGKTIWLRSVATPRRLENGDVVWSGITTDISDIKLAEQRVAESEQLLSGIIHGAMDAVITIDDEQKIIRFNPAAESIFRCSSEQALGQRIETFIPEPFRAQHRHHVEAFARSEGAARRMGESRVLSGRRLDGDIFPMEASISRVTVSGRELFTGVIRDLSERQRAERELREKERMMSTLLANLPGMVYRCRNDADWTMEFVSDGAAALTGCDLEDLRSNRASFGRDLIHPDDRGSVWNEVQTAIARRSAFQLEYRLIRPDGQERWVWERGQGVFDDQQRLVALEGFVTDITDRRKATEDLRESEARLQAILEHAPNVAIEVFDRQGRVVFWNRAAEQLYGFTRQEAIGKTLDQLILNPEATRDFQSSIDRIAATGQPPPPMDWQFTGKGGRTGTVYAGLFPITFGQGRQAFVCMDVDITARRRAEDDLRLANERLESRVRERTAQLEEANQELEAFTYSVSHDLRSPVRHISSYARILLEEHGALFTEDARHCASAILGASTKLGQLIDDLLNFSRLGRQAVQPQVLDMGAMVHEVWSDITRARPDSNARLSVRGLPTAWADAALMRHVWFNLLDNAVKYSAGRPCPEIRVEAFRRDGRIWYAVQDKGVGFDPRYADRLFGVFQRLHREEEFPGTGVGLALVRRIIHKHGGEIVAEGRPEQGATFSFTLPENADEPSH